MTVVPDDIEQLARRLLELLARVTGLESTYLTRIDLHRQEQEIVVSHNAAEMHIGDRCVDGDALLRRADDALYAAKAAGRDCVATA